ncbi:glycosyltransferase family 4 protein [Echinicola sediminis]
MKSTKKVLIITYYWPPSAGSGVQRWLKFAKYLPENGWEPVIFTPENPDFELQDKSMLQEISKNLEVIKFPIWEPYGLFRSFKKHSKSSSADPFKILEKKKKGWFDKLIIWLRANLLVPDPRVFWVKPAVDYLMDFTARNQIDAVITTGPPHSIHLIGRNLKRKTGLPWIADFRDPWTGWGFLDALPMTPFIKKRHKNMEVSVLSEADRVISVTPSFVANFSKKGKRKVDLITNGYDAEDLGVLLNDKSKNDDTFEVVHTGVINVFQSPLPFIEAFKELFVESGVKAKLTFVGQVSEEVREFIQQDSWLKEHTELIGYVSHRKVFDYYQRASALLLILPKGSYSKGNIPGKLFEYLSTGKKIIGIGDPQGDAAAIIGQTSAGKVLAENDTKGMKDFLALVSNSPKSSTLPIEVQQFERKSLTKKLAKILDEFNDDTVS